MIATGAPAIPGMSNVHSRARQQMIQFTDQRFDRRFRSSITSTEWREVSTLV